MRAPRIKPPITPPVASMPASVRNWRHDAAALHADGAQDADLARALVDRHHQRVRDDRGGDAQDDEVEDIP